MDINEWEGWYVEILDDFGFLRNDDENTADLLNEILEKHGFLTIDELYSDMENKKNIHHIRCRPLIKSKY